MDKKFYFRGLQKEKTLLYLTTLKHNRTAHAVPIKINEVAQSARALTAR